MSYYIALIHKETDSDYGVSFPGVPGTITAGKTLAEAMHLAANVLEFAADGWDGPFPAPRSIDELRMDPTFLEDAADAVIAAVPFREKAEAAE
jgi:predicted RNase H-like HicB family nuclease